MKAIITGGAGFIGSALCRHLVQKTGYDVINIDKLTYAANLKSLAPIMDSPRYLFCNIDICDQARVSALLEDEQPDLIFHLAAETHVDRSIDSSAEFIRTNVLGTHALLEAARLYWATLKTSKKEAFRFLHISTDEVFGALTNEGQFNEQTRYKPSSPYSASKAGADHLARAWYHTYGLPVVVTNCSNNYGPYQFPEKLIPLMIINAWEQRPLPVFGNGSNIRDWLHVDDHVEALMAVAQRGAAGETYAIGGGHECTNLNLVQHLCDLLDQRLEDGFHRRDLIEFVEDRPGHDFRYSIDATKISHELGWRPAHTFETGLKSTVEWYLENEDWWGPIRKTTYKGSRLGVLNRQGTSIV